MSETLRDYLVIAATAVLLLVAVVVAGQEAGRDASKGHRSPAPKASPALLLPYFLTPPLLRAPFQGQLPALPSMTSEEAHGG